MDLSDVTVRDVVESKLSGLDVELLEYIVTMLEEDKTGFVDSETNGYLAETIASFLNGVEFCASEDAATALAHGLILNLSVLAADKAAASAAPLIPKLVPAMKTKAVTPLQAPKQTAIPLESEPVVSGGGIVVSKASKTREPKAPKSAREPKGSKEEKDGGKSSKKLSASERAEQIDRELDAELAAARIRSAISRSRDGAYNGAIDAQAFTLPNPGGGPPLLENAAFTLVRGRRYGLIGRNGKGKSTLLKALAARRYGEIPDNVTVHYVSQEVQLTNITREQTPLECVLAADIERTLLLEEMARLDAEESLTVEQQQRQGEIMEQLEIIEADSAERRAVELLDNLGFTEELKARPLKALSGGWRVRTMLAAAIFAKPDILLLDEPTNHLSILAVMWLARELSTSETWEDRIVAVVSHDRYFIDEVCTDCLHISGVARRLTQTHGNYSNWAAKRKEQQTAFAREANLRQIEIDKLKEFSGHGFK
jgi:ATP-binding cassette, subfamily F, member 3